jgi:FkbM family methyltransferase
MVIALLTLQQMPINLEKSQNLRSEERIIIKEVPVVRPSIPKLHPKWQELVLSASETISFKIMKMKAPEPGLDYRFWYPVEDTLHSAAYIIDNEQAEVKWWVRSIESVKRLKGRCNALDVGSNGGFFSLLSRSLGCNVLAVDAQPWCLTRLSSGASINGFYDKIATRWTAVSDVPNMTITVGATKCSGLWAVKNSEWINEESSQSIEVQSTSCTALVNEWLPDSSEIINLMKIDAEGSEVGIIRSALPLLKAHRIEHILAEFVPGRTKEITPFPLVQETFTELYSAGYQCFKSVNGGVPVDLPSILYYFDPQNQAKGRNTPSMWRCSLSLQ